MDTELAIAVGARVRTVRHERGLSLGALAAAAGIGKGSLSELENGTRNPTLATLYALAGALGVPLATLLAERAGSTVASPGIDARLLDAAEHPDGTVVEVYLLSLDPSSAHRSPSHGPGVREHLLLTSGRARVGRVGGEVDLGPGQAVTWVSDVEHGYAAVDGPATAVLVITSPGDRGE
ncbi:helix-turn-helix domain-containing protein [Nocardioides sp. CER19]|uniref:helix-turn-helix domain-containing protein n=1 Tax=Nocardioides sp. CER19 TaxID=3038538 RepID=UPI00244BF3C5|nr:helix-turn-helix domain-containing protein [Nocardioides sp. CER19]MDH2412885.1 helix-turn-helix domain-containing protein [Nocardioides sp. CER19]